MDPGSESQSVSIRFDSIKDYPYGVMVIDGVRFVISGPLESWTEFGRQTFSIGRVKQVYRCDCCGRANIVPDVCHSIEELIAKEWIMEESKYLKWRSQ